MQSTVRRRQHRCGPRAIRTLLLPSQPEALPCDSLLLCSVFPALVRLVHAACRTSALNQNHVALVTLLRSCLAHDCGIARTHARYAADAPLSQVCGSSGGEQWDLSMCPCLSSHAKHSPILREWVGILRHGDISPVRHQDVCFSSPGREREGFIRDGGSSCNQLLTTSLIF